MYIIGLRFTIETDHKSLDAMLGTRTLSDVPPGPRLGLLRYNYHIPGKALTKEERAGRRRYRTLSAQSLYCSVKNGGQDRRSFHTRLKSFWIPQSELHCG